MVDCGLEDFALLAVLVYVKLLDETCHLLVQALPDVTHRRLHLVLIELCVLGSQCVLSLVLHVDAPITRIRQGDVVDAEPKLLTQAVDGGILVTDKQVTQFSLRSGYFPIVCVQELLHEIKELGLQRSDLLLVFEILRCR